MLAKNVEIDEWRAIPKSGPVFTLLLCCAVLCSSSIPSARQFAWAWTFFVCVCVLPFARRWHAEQIERKAITDLMRIDKFNIDGKRKFVFSSISLSYCCCCSISLIQTTKCQCVCIVCSIQWVLLDYVCVCKKQNQTVWLCLPVNNNDWPRDRPTDQPTVWPANGNSLPNGGNHQFSGHRNACSLFRSPPEFEASAVRHCLPAPNTSIFHFMLSDKIHTISTNIEWNGEIHFVFRINNEYTIYYCKSMRLKSISADEWCAQTPALFLRIVLLLFGLPFRMRVTRRCAMCNVEG